MNDTDGFRYFRTSPKCLDHDEDILGRPPFAPKWTGTGHLRRAVGTHADAPLSGRATEQRRTAMARCCSGVATRPTTRRAFETAWRG